MRRLLIFITIFCLSLGFFNLGLAQAAIPEKKAVLLVMDYIDTSDIELAHTPNLDLLVKQSGIGLMNIRAKNRTPGSSYMSIAVGSRAGTINTAAFSFNSSEPISNLPNVFEKSEPYWTAGELYKLFTGNKPPAGGIVNLYTENIKKNALVYNPSYEAGQIGKIARLNQLRVTALGNADTIDTVNRNVALLAMDEKGIIPQGDVGLDLILYDPASAGGLKTNHEVLLQKFLSYLPSSDLLILDLGDTSRVEMSRLTTADHIVLAQRKSALERNDEFLGKLLAHLDLSSTLLLIITPNPNLEMFNANNFGLTPVLIHNPDNSSGLLTSATTRRTSLITNADILPTIFSYLGADFTANGNPVKTKNDVTYSFSSVNQELNLYKNLRLARNPLHLLFISMILLSFVMGLWINSRNLIKTNFLIILVNAILAIPIIWLFISLTTYQSLLITLLLTAVISLGLGIILNLIFNPLNNLLILSGLTSLLLAIDCFTGSRLMLLSPLGSDAIAGGRYYGMGNDFMGILLASSVIFIVLLVYKLRIPQYLKAIIAGLFLLLITGVIGHPSYGANVGGLITSIVTTGALLLFTTNRSINLRRLIILGLFALIGVIGVAQLDFLYSSNPSHAGKAVNSLLNGGYQVFYSIIRTKLGILVNTVYTSKWSIVMLGAVPLLIYLWRKFNAQITLLTIKLPGLILAMRVLIISAVTVFVVNDTGVIASALILTYIISSLWLGLNEV